MPSAMIIIFGFLPVSKRSGWLHVKGMSIVFPYSLNAIKETAWRLFSLQLLKFS